MSSVFGVLGVADTEAAFVANMGQQLIFDAINLVLGYHNEDVAKATNVFVKKNTEKFKMRWLSPGSGMMSPAGVDPLAPGPAVQRYGYWDVSFQLSGWEEAVSNSRVGLAYMTLAELNAHIDAITERNIARHRQRILIALMEDTNLAWTDPIHGALTIRRLANTDGALYPVLPGAAAEAEDDHYAETAYAIANITDINNPLVTLRNEIVEHFGGRRTGGQEIVVLNNADATAYIEALTGFVPVGDRHVNYGADTDLADVTDKFPGRLYGRHSGVWCVEWAWMPATYMMGVHIQYPPLMRRVDTAASGLPMGLSLVARDRDHPLESAYYADRFGYGAGNRLSAAVLEVSGGDATYTPPTAYTE